MDEFLIKLLNQMIAKNLPAINNKLDGEIKAKGLDPMEHVMAGSANLGTIHIGVTASVTADYLVSDLTGLSSVAIDSLVISPPTGSVDTTTQGTNLRENFTLKAHLANDLQADFTAKVMAKAGFIKESQNVAGKVAFKGVKVQAGGTMEASVSGGTKICLEQVFIESLTVNISSDHITFSELGIFSPFQSIITNKLQGLINTKVKDLSGQATRAALNTAIAGIDIPCEAIPGA